MMFSNIGNWFSSRNIPVTAEDCLLVREHTQTVKIPAHTIILPAGKPAPKLFFLNSGIVRMFHIHHSEDRTVDFISGHEFVSTALYVLNQQPSPYGLETLTEVDALQWERPDLVLFENNLSAPDKIKNALLDRLLTWTQERETDIMSLMPEERYLKLIEYQPEIIKSVSLRYIASYLGVHSDSLSRIRKKLASKRKAL